MPNIRNPAVQAAVADAYIQNGGNQLQAVLAAGYSPRTARSDACKLVAHPGVQALIRRGREPAAPHPAGMEEINQFWSDVLRDPSAKLELRLRASELRAKASGQFANPSALPGPLPVVICGENDLA